MKAVFGKPELAGVRFGELRRWRVTVKGEGFVEVESFTSVEARRAGVAELTCWAWDEDATVELLGEDGEATPEPEPYWPQGAPREQMRMFEEAAQ